MEPTNCPARGTAPCGGSWPRSSPTSSRWCWWSRRGITFLACGLQEPREGRHPSAGEDTLIDTGDDRLAALEGRIPVPLVAGGACEPALLEHVCALTADLVIATTGDDEGNLVISLLAERQFSVPRVAARVNDADDAWLFDQRWGSTSPCPLPRC